MTTDDDREAMRARLLARRERERAGEGAGFEVARKPTTMADLLRQAKELSAALRDLGKVTGKDLMGIAAAAANGGNGYVADGAPRQTKADV